MRLDADRGAVARHVRSAQTEDRAETVWAPIIISKLATHRGVQVQLVREIVNRSKQNPFILLARILIDLDMTEGESQPQRHLGRDEIIHPIVIRPFPRAD